jgi:hypothetical protein
MTEFDFDVVTGPSGPMCRGPSACGWTPAEATAPPPLALAQPSPPLLAAAQRQQGGDAGGDA